MAGVTSRFWIWKYVGGTNCGPRMGICLFRLGDRVPALALPWTDVNLLTQSTYSTISASHLSCRSPIMSVSLFPFHAFILLLTCCRVSGAGMVYVQTRRFWLTLAAQSCSNDFCSCIGKGLFKIALTTSGSYVDISVEFGSDEAQCLRCRPIYNLFRGAHIG